MCSIHTQAKRLSNSVKCDQELTYRSNYAKIIVLKNLPSCLPHPFASKEAHENTCLMSCQSYYVQEAPGLLLQEPPYLTTTSPHYDVNRGNAPEGVLPLSGVSRNDREGLCE